MRQMIGEIGAMLGLCNMKPDLERLLVKAYRHVDPEAEERAAFAHQPEYHEPCRQTIGEGVLKFMGRDHQGNAKLSRAYRHAAAGYQHSVEWSLTKDDIVQNVQDEMSFGLPVPQAYWLALRHFARGGPGV